MANGVKAYVPLGLGLVTVMVELLPLRDAGRHEVLSVPDALVSIHPRLTVPLDGVGERDVSEDALEARRDAAGDEVRNHLYRLAVAAVDPGPPVPPGAPQQPLKAILLAWDAVVAQELGEGFERPLVGVHAPP